jgi:predicted metal-dependent phosphotriesterase family hydrolase
LIGGTEATGHEAEAKFQKKTQQHQIRPTFARLGTRQGRCVEQPQLSRRKAGAWVEFDGISSAAAQKHVELVLGMKQAGYLSRVLLSQDSGWYHVGEPGGGNFRPYDFLLVEFLPLLGRAGVSAKEIETIMIRNARAVLTVPRFQ